MRGEIAPTSQGESLLCFNFARPFSTKASKRASAARSPPSKFYVPSGTGIDYVPSGAGSIPNFFIAASSVFAFGFGTFDGDDRGPIERSTA